MLFVEKIWLSSGKNFRIVEKCEASNSMKKKKLGEILYVIDSYISNRQPVCVTSGEISIFLVVAEGHFVDKEILQIRVLSGITMKRGNIAIYVVKIAFRRAIHNSLCFSDVFNTFLVLSVL